jgi:hypothetical protein
MEGPLTVEAIRLKNFMAFEDSGWIELKPITLLFGRNSSGKSAILRAVELLRQSRDLPGSRGPLAFSVRGGVDLGEFKDAVHGKVSSREIGFAFRCRNARAADLVDSLVGDAGASTPGASWWKLPPGAPPELEIEIRYGADEESAVSLRHISVCLPWASPDGVRNGVLIEATRLRKADATSFQSEWYLHSDIVAAPSDGQDLRWEMRIPGRYSVLFPDLVLGGPSARGSDPDQEQPPGRTTDMKAVAEVIAALSRDILQLLEDAGHLEAMRPPPRRVYELDSTQRRQWSDSGLGAFMDYLAGRLGESAANSLDAWLSRLKLANTARAWKRPAPDGLGFEAHIDLMETEGTDYQVAISSAGYGTSQVLPVILAAATTTEGQMLMIEQPELHLHPRAQAELADLFVERIRFVPDEARLKELDEAKAKVEIEHQRTQWLAAPRPRFLLETHSEHMLLRLRLRIAEQYSMDKPDLLADDIRIYFVDRPEGAGRSTVERVEIGRLGQMSAPKGFRGFFAADLDELAELNRVVLAAQGQQR